MRQICVQSLFFHSVQPVRPVQGTRHMTDRNSVNINNGDALEPSQGDRTVKV